ncbi:MAG: hypothetical protein JKX85_05060 [Phycisphaeraceae bacterium]|nr:hypothetical protein [Phycisphaeraceae bacterium]
MDMVIKKLPNDFKEFLKLLSVEEVEYLLVGGYAVGYHGYPRATSDMDIWIAMSDRNAIKTTKVLADFGFQAPNLNKELFLRTECLVRMGTPPFRIEILTDIDGVEFDSCYKNACFVTIDQIDVPIISLADLKQNKLASGRHKDLDDLENLP